MSGSVAPRRRVSQQRYAMRRLGVVTVLAVLVFGAVKAIDMANGRGHASGQRDVGSQPATSAAPAGDGVAAGAAAGPTTTAATPPPVEEEEEEESGPPSSDNPAEVLIVGDSDAGTFFPYLQRLLDETGIVDADVDYVVSSGLARPDFHDWPAHLRESMARGDPDIVVVTFGGNDAQGLTEPCPNGAGTCGLNVVVPQPTASNAAEWRAEYSRRVAEVLDILLADDDRRVVWVGIPNAANEEFTERLRIQDQAVREALGDYPEVVFVDTWDRFDGRNGGIAELIVDPRDGRAKPVRQSDGFHLNADGAEILALDIAEQVEAILGDLGADV